MKKLIIALGLGLIITMFNTNKLEAQHISVNINLDYQPAWGPYGYEYAAYYYFPDLNIYYDVDYGLFIYPSGRRWVSSAYLPKKYRKYDLYMMYKVVINDIYDPWTYNQYHRRNYAHYCNNRSQVAIYYVNDRHYHRAKQNHWAWVEPRYMPKQSNRNHKHLAHQHKPAQINNNSHRSSGNNYRNTPTRSQNQVNGNNRSQTRNQQSTTGSNRVENRSSGVRNSESRSSAATRQSENRSSSRNNNQAIANDNNKRTESRSSSSASKQNDVRKSESRSSSSRNNNQAAANNNTKRTETRSASTRSSQRASSTEKRSTQKESNNQRSQEKTDSRSGNSSRSSGRR